MNCPKCQFENPEDAKFCVECGNKIEITCPKCSSTNSPSFKFCRECGQKLSLASEAPTKDLSFDEKLAKIQKYLPKGLTEKILSQRDRIEGERKHVTVMFCDMEGFTSLSERLGPEEAYAIMDQVYEILIHKVHDYEGTVNEFTGDGIMALFGAPIALEDAPQRAIRSAYAIHREMTKFSEKIKQGKEKIPSIKMRIGIHTGPVVVGTLGNDLRVEFKAVGDTVNLASRIEGLAIPGSTYVSKDTFKLTEGLFRFEALGEHAVKGRAESVKAYRVIAPSTSRTRFDVSAERGLTPFVGRERELELLLDGFERSKAGRGQAISVMAEAGVGKSRLLYEFRKAVSNEDVTFQEGKCLSYSKGVAYHPVIDIVKANFDIRAEDGDFDIREKLKRGLEILDVDEASTLPYLLEFLSVKDSGADPIALSSETRKDRIIKAIIRIAIKASQIRSLIIAIEDLHWLDRSSEDYLKDLLDSITGERVFLILTHRPEFVHTWGAKSYHSQVNLNRLSNRESLAMVTHLLGTEDIDHNFEELILEKTEGVPFFIEELIKSLKDLNAIEREDGIDHLSKDIQAVSIPSTIHDVIMARIDRLPEGAKSLLQTGSVIEREFSYELIKKVTGIPEQTLLSHLSRLKDAELLYERGIFPGSTYIFKHALTREVAYNSILLKRKKELHAAIGQAIEEAYQENLSEYYGILVEHFIEAEYFEKAAEYSKQASKKSLNTASLLDAIKYVEKTIFSLEKLPLTDEIQNMIIDGRARLGLNFLEMNYYHEAQKAIEPIIDVIPNISYQKRIPQLYTIIGAGRLCIEEDFPGAFDYLEKALTISNDNNDIGAFVNASFWMGFARAVNCEFDRALYNLQQNLSFHEKSKNSSHIPILKGLLSFLYYNWKGDIETACHISKEAVLVADETHDAHPMLFAYACHGANLFTKGLLDEAKNYLTQAMEFNERAKQFWWNFACNQYLGDVYYDSGEYRKAADHYMKGINLLKDTNVYPSWLNMSQLALTKTNAKIDEESIKWPLLANYAAKNKMKMLEGQIHSCISEIFFKYKKEQTDEAEKWILQAIKADLENGMRWNLARDYALYAELIKRKDDVSQAKEKLNKAIDIFKESGADGWVEKYEKELEALS